MKGLIDIPNIKDFANAYGRLQNSGGKISVQEYALWSQWSRFDARLAEQMVFAFSNQWKIISPIELNSEIRLQPWPSAMGVILGHAAEQTTNRDHSMFKHWSNLVLYDVQPESFPLYFIGLFSAGSNQIKKESEFPTKPYLNWGYLGNAYLWNKRKPNRTIASRDARINKINELIKLKKRFTVKDYIKQLDDTVEKRQAERDLSGHPKLKASGKTKGRYYTAV